MNRKDLSMLVGVMISIASMATPVTNAGSVGLVLTVAAVALDAKPVAAERCAKLMIRSKALGIGCFAAGYSYRGALEILKAVGLHQLAKQIEEAVGEVSTGAPEVSKGYQVPGGQ